MILELDDEKWATLEGGYRGPFDPRPLLSKLSAAWSNQVLWDELWQELYHQGDIGIASIAVVPHLVRLHREKVGRNWNVFALVGSIDLAAGEGKNPTVPPWLEPEYSGALADLGRNALEELLQPASPEETRCMLGIVALWKRARSHARVLIEFEEDEVLELIDAASQSADE